MYELNGDECSFIGLSVKGGSQRLILAALLKTRQQLGYFPCTPAAYNTTTKQY